ncbi:MAG TPA: MarR family transcriptional regulator [Anaeromyxobacteraceae bacterium]|nr:MarR family transcriptional regulator [Anaeromyxobacteraceae bacterium]
MPTAPRAGRPLDLGPVMGFLRLVWALDHALTRRSKRMQRSMGVTGTQRFVLRLAVERPGISAGELAVALHLDPSTLTGVLARLTRRGLLRRAADAGDGRRALFHPTGSGRAVACRQEGSVEACALEALGGVPPDDVLATGRVLRALIAALEEQDGPVRGVSAPGAPSAAPTAAAP